jgi:DNA-binding YbaB/EbfC family protein
MAQPDMNKLLEQAQEMQKKMEVIQKRIAAMVIIGESGAGMVKVHLNGQHRAVRVELSDAALKEDKDVVEDLVAAAINAAADQIESAAQKEMGGLQGFDLPKG